MKLYKALRAGIPGPWRAGGSFALLLLSLCCGLACRDAGIPPGMGPGVPFAMHFRVGDQFTYARWQFDDYGYVIPSTQSPGIMHVLAEGVEAFGKNRVVVIEDSTLVDSTHQWAVDTAYYALDPNGDVYQYGLVAGVVGRLTERSIAPAWDDIAAFSQGLGTPWVIGAEDSAGSVELTGTIAPQQDYFALPVNGVQTAVAAYHVEISSSDYALDLWLADAPSSFPRMVEGGNAVSNGFLQDLTSLQEGNR